MNRAARQVESAASYVDHSIDVADAAALRLRDPVLRARLSSASGIPITDVHAAGFSVLAGVHDIGKIGSGFQRMLQGERTAWRHVAGGLDATPVLQSEIRDLLSWWSDPAAALYASICHHGGPVAKRDVRAQAAIVGEHIGEESIDGLRELLRALRDRYASAWEDAAMIPWTPALDHLLAGIIMGADWLGSGAYRDIAGAYRAAGT